MVLSNEAVEAAKYKILEAAEKGDWRLSKFGKSHTTSDKIVVNNKDIGDSPELLRAFDLMLKEHSWIEHDVDIYYIVTSKGTNALDAWRSGQNPLINQTPPPTVANVYNSTITNYAPSVNVAAGGTANSIKQINHHISSIRDHHSADVADALQSITDVIETEEIPNKEEARGRIHSLSREIDKPIEDQQKWEISEKLDGLLKFSELADKARETGTKLLPLIHVLIAAVKSLCGIM